jgi:uncharacterized protein (TIGR02453 family)
MAEASEFVGFSKGLINFLKGLERNNSKAWFDAHRDAYDEFYLEPAKAFASALAPALKKLDPQIRCEPRVNGAIMRINRDTRFSKDKTPYKTGMHFRLPCGDGKGGAGFYLRIAARSVGIAGGAWAFDPKMMARYRKAVVDPKQGKAFRAAIDKVRKAGPYELSEPEYKRVPKGFDPEHPNAELLRYKSFFASIELGLPKEFFSKQAVPFVVGHFKRVQPVQSWLAKVVG